MLRGAPSHAQHLAECPYCHRPFNHASDAREASAQESFVSPQYFRMLANDLSDSEREPPSSPIRRLVRAPQSPRNGGDEEAEFVASAPAATSGHIKRDAFSPNYFKRFFVEEKELGRGGKGVVLLVRHELDGVNLGHFACKRVPVGDDHGWLEKVLIEVQLLQGLSHPNLVSYRHVWLEDVKLGAFSPSVPCAFILQQYCNSGDLLHFIAGNGPSPMDRKEEMKERMRRRSKGQAERPVMNPAWVTSLSAPVIIPLYNTLLTHISSQQRKLGFDEIYSFFKDITSGLAHLHASNYIHRDLKPSNCLLHRLPHPSSTPGDHPLRCLISDFGEVQSSVSIRKSTGATGTISYCAPEVLRLDSSGRYGNFTTKSDIFSLGMILYFMCFGRLPYNSAESIQEEFEDLETLRAEISNWGGYRVERRERPDLPDQLYDFLKMMLALDPNDRPHAADILAAIRTGSGLGATSERRGTARRDSSERLGLAGKVRIQPVDSPMPPGTPVNGTSRMGTRVVSSAYAEDEDDGDGYGEGGGSPHAGSVQTVSSSQRSQSPVLQRSQSPVLERTVTATNQIQAPAARQKSPERVDRVQLQQRPLLLPPPPPATRMAILQTRATRLHHRALEWVLRNQQMSVLPGKMAVFLLKVYMLQTPCSPSATKGVVLYPLFALAALDLGMGWQMKWRDSFLLLVVHLVVVNGMAWWGALCVEDHHMRGLGLGI